MFSFEFSGIFKNTCLQQVKSFRTQVPFHFNTFQYSAAIGVDYSWFVGTATDNIW